MDRLQMSCEHVSLELTPKTSETVSGEYKMKEDCSKRRGRSMRTDDQPCWSMKTVLKVDNLRTRDCLYDESRPVSLRKKMIF